MHGAVAQAFTICCPVLIKSPQGRYDQKQPQCVSSNAAALVVNKDALATSELVWKFRNAAGQITWRSCLSKCTCIEAVSHHETWQFDRSTGGACAPECLWCWPAVPVHFRAP